MYKCINHIAPDYLCDLFCLNADIYQVNTRSTQVNNIHVPATSISYFS